MHTNQGHMEARDNLCCPLGGQHSSPGPGEQQRAQVQHGHHLCPPLEAKFPNGNEITETGVSVGSLCGPRFRKQMKAASCTGRLALSYLLSSWASGVYS